MSGTEKKKRKCSGVPSHHIRSKVAGIYVSSESSEFLVILHDDRKIWVIHSRSDESE